MKLHEAFANYLQEFNKINPKMGHIFYYISFILHSLILPVSVYILLFTNNLLLFIVLIIFYVGVLWHWEIYGECILTTIERNLGDPNKLGIGDFKKIYGYVIYFILYYCTPPIIILFALFRIYYLKTTCKRR